MGSWEIKKAYHIGKAVISLIGITAFLYRGRQNELRRYRAKDRRISETIQPLVNEIGDITTLASILNCGHCKQVRRSLDVSFVDKR